MTSLIGPLPTAETQYWIITGASSLSPAFLNVPNGADLGSIFGSDFAGYSLYYNADQMGNALSGGNDVVITNVPEPSTVAIFGSAGTAGVLVWWRRRRKREQMRAEYFRECSYHQFFGYHLDPYELEEYRAKQFRQARKAAKRRR